MVITMDKKIDYLVVDTTAFIENAPLQVNITQLSLYNENYP